jgi:glutathione synthase/RimK-type ligase-like ATP-grasp enzyme
MNHPQATYMAEHKGFQLKIARDLGFAVPPTLIANSSRYVKGYLPDGSSVALKGLETVFLRTETTESFGFTTFSTVKDLLTEDLHDAPAVIQRALVGKLDIRATVVGDKIFAAEIAGLNGSIQGDWRTVKDQVHFSSHYLPEETAGRCIALVRRLGLVYGAIDLALAEGQYWFLEINPTGEWAWLVDSAGLAIDAAIADWIAEIS